MGNAILFLRRSLGTVCGLAFEQSLQDGGCAAEGVLKPDGVGIVVGGVRAEAATPATLSMWRKRKSS